jgi:hypothetical protein
VGRLLEVSVVVGVNWQPFAELDFNVGHVLCRCEAVLDSMGNDTASVQCTLVDVAYICASSVWDY